MIVVDTNLVESGNIGSITIAEGNLLIDVASPDIIEVQADRLVIEETNIENVAVSSIVSVRQSTSNILTGTAGENINATDIIYIDEDGLFWKADNTIPAQESNQFAVSMYSVLTGASLTALTFGKTTNAGYSAFTNESKVYLNGVGAMSITPPTTGYLLSVGKKLGGNDFFCDIQRAIILI